MKIIFNFILVTTFTFSFYVSVLSQVQSAGLNNVQGNEASNLVNPLYDLRVTNVQVGGTSPTLFNTIFFDILIYHTNLIDSGPFEFSSGQYYFNFNPLIANGGTLSYEIIPNSTEFTNPDAIPTNPAVVGNQLRLARNIILGAGNGPIVSSVYPGTRVIKMKLTTTAPSINYQDFDLSWRDSTYGDPYTEIFAYIGTTNTDITNGGTLIVDSTNIPLPVELSSFVANINRNNIELNWSTTLETNNSGFEIERRDSRGETQYLWTKIGFVPGNGTVSMSKNYSFTDRALSTGRYKYRLKQIDFNGNYEYYDLLNEVVVGIPDRFILKQNYPNPFNPATKIDFDIPMDAFIILKLFDTEGRQIKTLVNEFKNSGYYTIEVDASALPSGAYYYKLVVDPFGESGNFFSTKKLIVLK